MVDLDISTSILMVVNGESSISRLKGTFVM